jgi:hypothetical protein
VQAPGVDASRGPLAAEAHLEAMAHVTGEAAHPPRAAEQYLLSGHGSGGGALLARTLAPRGIRMPSVRRKTS